MAISSGVWASPSLPIHRSPNLPLRELAVGPRPLWQSPKPRTTPRAGGHRRQLSNATAKALAIPRKFRRPSALVALFLLLSLVVVYILAGQASRVVSAAGRAVIVAPALLRHVTGTPYRAWVARRKTRLAKLALPTSTNHLYHPNGLVVVNERGTHPILDLVARAEREWKAKVAKQSKTLDEATAEYKRRYRRNPPRGWEKWWAYAQANNVPLVDEYDQIDRDLKAFFALNLEDMRHRNRVMQDREGTFTMAIRNGEVSLHGAFADLRRATDIADIVKRFSADVKGDVNLTFIIDDQPAVMLPWEQKNRMHELAHLGEQFGPSEYFDQESSSLSNYANACPPGSPLRKSETGELVVDFSAASGQRSFVWDHTKAMDICQHPESRALHGLSATQGTGLGPLVPLFAFAKMSTHGDILATPLEQYWDSYEGYDPVWELKTQNRLLWRGTTTGADFSTKFPWRDSQRARLHFMSHEKTGQREVLNTVGDQGQMKLQNVSAADLNSLYLDTSFAGGPAQCDEATCKLLADTVDFAPTQGLADSYQYKYMMDVDGNGWSGRFHRLMSTRSLVLKSTIFPEWYADRVQPWLHYVPVKVDYTDLYDIMSFFVGSVDGHGGHDQVAARLAENGRQWAKTHWRREDMASYMMRLILEYSRLLNSEDLDSDYLG